MSTLRFRALETALDRKPLTVIPPSIKISDFFGNNVFGKEAMQKYLPREAYKAVIGAIDHGV